MPTSRAYFALRYRAELKTVVLQQVTLARIAAHVISRVAAGVAFDSACAKVPDMEADDGTTRGMMG